MTCADIEAVEDAEIGAIASALRCDIDIPPASADFSRRCYAAAAGSVRPERRIRRHSFPLLFAIGIAAVSSLFTWLATVSAMSQGRHVDADVASSSADVVEDVSALGVETPGDLRGIIRAAPSAVAMSNECVVNADPNSTVLWKALNAGQSQMAWEWPYGARSARLTIAGRGKTAAKVFAEGDAFPVWNPVTPADFDEEDVFTAKLTFYRGLGAAGGEISSLVADGIGFVHGVSGEASGFAADGGMRFDLARYEAVRWMELSR